MLFKGKYLAFALALLLLACAIVFIGNSKGKEKKLDSIEKIKLTTFEIKDRINLVKNGEIYIGATEKELENNFYDVKISVFNTGIKLTLNKLWRYECNAEYIEDEYLIEVVDNVIQSLGVGQSKIDMSYELYKYIKQNFIKVKNKEKAPTLILENIKIYSESIDGECIIYIEKEV